jgi:predicted amidohydrolase YtcJ
MTTFDVCCPLSPELSARAHIRSGGITRLGDYLPPVVATAGKADLIVLGAVVTMDPGQPSAGAIAVAGGRVVAVGTSQDVESWSDAHTEILELGDHVAYPGFIEPHMHIVPTALFESAIDCSPFVNRRFADVVERLRQARTSSPDQWVIGRSFDPSLFEGEPILTRDVLDQISPDRPMAVMNASMHYLYVNSVALHLAGVTDDTPDPEGGVFYRENGRLNGVLGESGAMARFLPHLPVLSPEELDDAIVRVLERAAAQGITQVHDAGIGAVFGAAELELLHDLRRRGRLPVRVSTALVEDARASWDASGVSPGDGDDWVRAVSWKIISDGSNQGYSGFQRSPYQGSTRRGQPNLSEDQLAAAIGRAHGKGWQVMVHANGDAAIDLTLRAYARALHGSGQHDQRHRIEHCSLAHQEQLAEMARLGLSPSFLMNHVYFWGRALRDVVLGPERADLLDPVGSALAAGLRPSYHSDHSVSPLGALRHVQTATTRKMHDGGEVLNPNERIDAATALRGVTSDAAWQIHADHRAGSIRVGNAADIVVLSDDPRHVEPDAIADIHIVETWVDGRRAWTDGALSA